jgi:hypothetical protein
MKKLFSPVFAIALCFVSCHDHFSHAAPLAQDPEAAKVGGKWVMTIDTPHGAVKGPLQVQQDGVKLTATFEGEQIGSLSLTGTVEGKKVSFVFNIPNSEETFTFAGTVDGTKMSGTTVMGGTWSASRE